MQNPDVTIAVVPNQRFSLTRPALESVFSTAPQVPLVYVDGGSPAPVARYLRRQADEKGFKLVRTDYYLTPNQARNLALAQVKTKYVVFLENDLIVSEGWLDALVRCAEETGAWLVGPLTMSESLQGRVIHAGAREMWIEEINGRRLFFDQNDIGDKKMEDVPPLTRHQCDEVEFHCLLVRLSCFDAVGQFDEQLLCTREHCDFCLIVNEAGGQIFFEPKAVVYFPKASFAWSDMPYYLLRWSEDWSDASIDHFKQKWRLAADDPMVESVRSWITQHRQSFLWQFRPFLDRFTGGRGYGFERLVLVPLEIRISRLIADKAARRGRRSGYLNVARLRGNPAARLTSPLVPGGKET